MTDSLLMLCLGLTVLAGGLKYRIRFNLGRHRREIAVLKAQRLKAVAHRRQVEDELAYAELKERELANDCRQLTGELQEVEAQLRELEAVAESMARRRQDREPLN